MKKGRRKTHTQLSVAMALLTVGLGICIEKVRLRHYEATRALFIAIRSGDAGRVEAALAAGADPSALSDGPRPSLLEEFRRLIGTSQPDTSYTPLSAAFFSGYKGPRSEQDAEPAQIVSELVSHGADVNQINGIAGLPPLGYAAGYGIPQCVRLLLEHGADANGRGRSGQPVLFCAVEAHNPECVRLLVTHGARVNDRFGGKTALSIAIRPGRGSVPSSDIIRTLRDAGGRD